VARRWPSLGASCAIGLGFVGVVLIIRPETSGLALGTLLPILAALFYACAMVLTSAKCRDDDPYVLALALNLTFIVSGIVLGAFSGQDGSFILGPWQTLDVPLMATIAALAALILVGSVGAAIAYQKGPPSTVAAFDYSYLVFSLLWGQLFFAELPDIVGLIGIAVIIAAGLLALRSAASD